MDTQLPPQRWLLDYLFSNNSEDSWEQLKQAVRFGFHRFTANQNTRRWVPEGSLCFQAPSYFKRFSPDSVLLVLGENVNIRKEAGLKAPIIAQVSYELLGCHCLITAAPHPEEVRINADGRLWMQVFLPDGREGYIAYSLTSVSVYRELTVAKLDGEWKIVSFFMAPGC